MANVSALRRPCQRGKTSSRRTMVKPTISTVSVASSIPPELMMLLTDLENRCQELARSARREVIQAGFPGRRFSGIAEEARDLATLSAQARQCLSNLP